MKEKLTTLPLPWARVHRISAGAMLNTERAAITALRQVANVATASMVVLSARSPTKLGMIAGIRSEAPTLALNLSRAIVDARAKARALALERLSVELTLVESQVGDLTIRRPPASDAAEDLARADAVAGSYTSTWSSTLLTMTLAWADDPTRAIDVAAAVDGLDYRIKRAAATEVSQAYSDEHDEGVGWVASTYKGAGWIGGLFKHWEGILDRRICPVCSAHDGEIAIAGTKFDDGDEPGFVHPICRCMDSLVFLPARMGQEVPGRAVGLEIDNPNVS